MTEKGQVRWASRSGRLFPMVLLATAVVFVLPIAVVWRVRTGGTVSSPWLTVAIAIAVSLAGSWILRLYWTHSRHRSDLLFSELMIWGWLARLLRERQLASMARLLWRLEHDPAFRGGALGRTSRLGRSERWRLVQRLATAVDAQDVYLHGHSRRVARHAQTIGRRMGLSDAEVARLRAAAIAHDVGKLCLPREVLDKPGPLTEAERVLMESHAEESARIVRLLGDPEITAIVRHHHERFDGSGYPVGLAGQDIPLGARILAVADTFDAITSDRPHRSAAEQRRAILTLRRCSRTQLDPRAVHAFTSSYQARRVTRGWTGLLAGVRQGLARLAGGRPSSPASTAANLLALVAATVAVAVAAGTPSGPSAALAAGRQPVRRPLQAVRIRSATAGATTLALVGQPGVLGAFPGGLHRARKAHSRRKAEPKPRHAINAAHPRPKAGTAPSIGNSPAAVGQPVIGDSPPPAGGSSPSGTSSPGQSGSPGGTGAPAASPPGGGGPAQTTTTTTGSVSTQTSTSTAGAPPSQTASSPST